MVSLVLVILGVAEVARRFRAEYEPDFTPVRAAATAAHARTVLTDSPIVLSICTACAHSTTAPSTSVPIAPGRAPGRAW